MIIINPKKCPQNHPCPAIRVCPKKAITQKGVGLPQINPTQCIECGKCITFCPMGAFEKSS